MHRGGANAGGAARPVLYLTLMARDDGLIPRQMGYTLPPADLGQWTAESLGERLGREEVQRRLRHALRSEEEP